jgi:hypothetical protein
MRLLVCGGRTFTDRAWLWAAIDLLHEAMPITEIIEGGATGADVRAGEWSEHRLGKKATVVEAEWERYSAGLKAGQKNPAGAIRNTEMAKMRPDLVLACPGGPGTAHMIATAHAYGLRVVLLERMPVVATGRAAQPNLEPPLPLYSIK